MLKITQTIIVEGKYDKIKLKSIADANVIETNGFGIYNDKSKRELIKSIAKKTGIIILTDSDAAGRRIRNYIKNCVGEEDFDGAKVINAYIPKIEGKEKRKAQPSKENTIGVEGTDKNLLTEVLKRFCVPVNSLQPVKKITKTDFFTDGFSGKKHSTKKREWLCGRLNIPYMPSNALLECVNILLDYDEYKKIIGECGDNICAI